MLRESKWLYQKTSEEEDLSPELVKSIGDSVFSEIRENMQDPQNLIMNIVGLGKFYLRSGRYAERLKGLKVAVQYSPFPIGPDVYEEIAYLEKRVAYLDEQYRLYREKKQRIREERNNFPD